MKVEKATMVACIKRIDGVDLSDKSKHYVKAYFEVGQNRRFAQSLRIDAADIAAVDPADTAHKSARGANAAIGSATVPTIENMQDWKRAAGALGAFPSGIRGQVLDLLREKADLVGDQVLAIFERAWAAGDLDEPSDDEAERAARGDYDDDTDEKIAKQKLAAQAREMLNEPSKADLARRDTPAYRARIK